MDTGTASSRNLNRPFKFGLVVQSAPIEALAVSRKLFAELKNQIGLRRVRLRRLKFVGEKFFLAAAAQIIKRLVHFLSQGPRPPLQATTT